MRTLTILLCAALTSCTFSNAKCNLAFGGKGAYGGRDFSVVWDNEKSFSDGAIIAGLAVGAYQATALGKAAEVTNRAVDANRSAEAINASNNAVKTTEIGAGVTKATTLNPNVLPK